MSLLKVLLNTYALINSGAHLKRFPASMTPERREYLDAWLSRKNIGAFLDFRANLGDAESQNALDSLVIKNLSVFCANNDPCFDIYPPEVWRTILAESENASPIKNTSRWEAAEIFTLNGCQYQDFVECKPGDVILDCGAYTGNSAIFFSAKTGGSGRVYAIEADQGIFTELADNIRNCGLNNISAYNYIPGDKTEKIQASLKYGTIEQIRIPSVKSISIDEFLANRNIDSLNLVRMNLHGGELEALKGARKMLERFMPMLEINVSHYPETLLETVRIIKEISHHYEFRFRQISNNFAGSVLFAKYMPDYQPCAVPDDEDTLISAWWLGIKNSINRKLMLDKKLLLELYASSFSKIRSLPIMPLLSDQYNFIAYPISNNPAMHFTFAFTDSGNVKIALNCEEWNELFEDALNEIIRLSAAKQPMNRFKYGCGYWLDDIYNHEKAGRLMAELAEISLPALNLSGLLHNNSSIFSMNRHSPPESLIPSNNKARA